MKNPIDISSLFTDRKLHCGRMLSASKKSTDGSICVWNSNVISPSKGKIWFGDLNITKEGKKLKEIATELGEPLYVLREHDARFGSELEPIESLIAKAVWSTLNEN